MKAWNCIDCGKKDKRITELEGLRKKEADVYRRSVERGMKLEEALSEIAIWTQELQDAGHHLAQWRGSVARARMALGQEYKHMEEG